LSRSLSLAAYRALSRRKTSTAQPAHAPRPPGELLWVHAADKSRMAALLDLGTRLKVHRPDLLILLTTEAEPGDAPVILPTGASCDWWIPLESDHPAISDHFLLHWRPDLALWTGGDLMPNLISLSADRSIPLLLVDVDETEVLSRSRWLPDPSRAALGCFQTVMARSSAAARALIRQGARPTAMTVTTALGHGVSPPPCANRLLSAVTEKLAARPVWCAAHVQPDEIDAVLAAHRQALRLSHRLLLVVSPDASEACGDIEARVAACGLRYAIAAPDAAIEDSTQVLLSQDPAQLGLWHRIAPVSFIGSSLTPGHGGRSPLDAAALGSAVLHGPNVRNHLHGYARLTSVGAAQIARDAAELGVEVIRAIAPDRAAEMALAGWQVVTEGAHVTDQLIDLIQDILDNREAAGAGA
jgi:3-deoxy-D-manno-octulosonic-acid transferase